MKYYLLIMGLFLSALSFQASAAKQEVNWGLVTTSQTGGHSDIIGEFEDVYRFTLPDNYIASPSATNSYISLSGTVIGKITKFAAELAGTKLKYADDTANNTQRLDGLFTNLKGGEEYELVITGIGSDDGHSSYGLSFTVAGIQTPIPAAAWLFGSALIGLAGVKRRKEGFTA